MDLTLVCPKCNRSYLQSDFERGEAYFECEQCQIELAPIGTGIAGDVADAPNALIAPLPNWAPGLLRPSELGSKYGGITLLIAVVALTVAIVTLRGRADQLLSFLPLLCVLSIVAAFIIGYRTQVSRNRAAIALIASERRGQSS